VTPQLLFSFIKLYRKYTTYFLNICEITIYDIHKFMENVHKTVKCKHWLPRQHITSTSTITVIHPEMVVNMLRVTLNFDLPVSKIPFVHFYPGSLKTYTHTKN